MDTQGLYARAGHSLGRSHCGEGWGGGGAGARGKLVWPGGAEAITGHLPTQRQRRLRCGEPGPRGPSQFQPSCHLTGLPVALRCSTWNQALCPLRQPLSTQDPVTGFSTALPPLVLACPTRIFLHFDFPVHSKVPVLPAPPPPPPRLLIHSRWTCPFPWDPSLSLHFSPAHQRICTAPPEPPVVTVRFAPATHLLRVSSLNEPFPSYRLVICTSNTSSLTSPFWGLLA